MKIVDDSPALLTNSEVVSVIKDRQNDSKATVQPSELQVLESLKARNANFKSREELQAFTAAINKEFNLTKEDIAQLINIVPKDFLEAFLCLEQSLNDKRVLEDDLDRILAIVKEHLHD